MCVVVKKERSQDPNTFSTSTWTERVALIKMVRIIGREVDGWVLVAQFPTC